MADEQAPDLQSENARLQAELTALRAREADAERRATAYEAQITDSSRRLATAQVSHLTLQEQQAEANLSSVEEEIKALKRQKVTLMAEGKFDEAADLDERLGDATARRREYQNAKSYYGNQRAQAAAVPADPVDRWLSERSGQYTEDEQRWIKQHRRYALDPDFQARVVEAHKEAVGTLGLSRGSPEYYAHLERRGYMQPEPVRAAPQQREQPAAQPQPQQPQAEAKQEPEQPEAEAETQEEPEEQAAADAEAPQIVIREESQVQEQRPENPQPRAAGPGSMRSAIAAAPTRRAPGAQESGRRTVATLTPEEKDVALSLAGSLAPEEVIRGGEAQVLLWYHDLKNSPSVRRMAANSGR